MTTPLSPAARLDQALDAVLGGVAPSTACAGLDVSGRDLVLLGAEVRGALPIPVVAPRFEARLGTRLAGGARHRDPLGWAIRHRGPLLVTGAVGSAAVGVGVTAFAVWRSSRRATGAAHRPMAR